ncbi:MAG: metalloregulator ArsR/SmtB family transcription factor [Nanoarchaeota archaeon]|nr:metalloregulator ArsR/SmtB family transcription factor [Nanoarchaeota archaeon]MBU1623183.1 metalloregulator ArsR/SmtB family transcription factor [Nanoarchaeota archaeon]MBU1974570.1 metalloregulator ArsR/SmtB family transcription factor [Nanoarchaeota archaeon]
MDSKISILKALGDETRFKIVLFLLNGRKSVSEITKHVQKAQPTISLQLKMLELLGLIKSERQGKQVFYQISNQTVFDLLKVLGVKK